ncbi:MAG: hypothetical protein QOI74_1177 [Micromonosporaceae bacterium]|jgi:hypothetical protein|nr:hypothetical protein [Micromonosporaceae bacterium]MDT5036367.1 hypothetical protein [Micromonosporaceae bacterium]
MVLPTVKPRADVMLSWLDAGYVTREIARTTGQVRMHTTRGAVPVSGCFDGPPSGGAMNATDAHPTAERPFVVLSDGAVTLRCLELDDGARIRFTPPP